MSRKNCLCFPPPLVHCSERWAAGENALPFKHPVIGSESIPQVVRARAYRLRVGQGSLTHRSQVEFAEGPDICAAAIGGAGGGCSNKRGAAGDQLLYI